MEQRVDRCDMLNEPLKRCTSRRGRPTGMPWTDADLFFLKDALARGMSLGDIAGFLSRTEEEVQEKARELSERKWAGAPPAADGASSSTRRSASPHPQCSTQSSRRPASASARSRWRTTTSRWREAIRGGRYRRRVAIRVPSVSSLHCIVNRTAAQ